MLSVQLPANAVAGGQIQIVDPGSGESFTVTVPDDAKPGQIIQVQPPRRPSPAQVAPTTEPVTGRLVDASGQPLAETPTVLTQSAFRGRSVETRCPGCGAVVMTQTTKRPGLMTWISAGALVCVGCWMGCCCIPFCIDDLKDTLHTCPECGTFIAEHKLAMGS